MLYLWTVETGTLGICPAPQPPGPRSWIYAIRHGELHHLVSTYTRGRHARYQQERFQFPRAEWGKPMCVWRQWSASRIRIRKMVDVLNRGMAARRGIAHSLQYDVDSPVGAP